MSDILLLPSAIVVPDELRLDLGRIPTGMIPLQGKPILQYIVNRYSDVEVFVACYARSEIIEAYVEREELDWTLIDVGDTDTVGETVFRSLEAIPNVGAQSTGYLYVNFSDTLVRPVPTEVTKDTVAYAQEFNPVRWTIFEGDERITTIVRKHSPFSQGHHNVFTGLFGIADGAAYHEELSSVLRGEQSGPDPFYTALQSYLSNREYELVEVDEWVDVGHLDTYYEAKKRFLNVREFNSLSLDANQNIITKTSDRVETLQSESNWYNALPDNLQPFVPRIYGYDRTQSRLKIEYVGYPSLRDIYLYGSHGLDVWNSIFESLFTVLHTFADHRTTADIQSSLEEIYVQKTRNRIARIDTDGGLSPFFGSCVSINGDKYPGIPPILESLEERIHESGLLDIDHFTVIHGDLCFANILYDLRNGMVKLIDPRGKFGQHVIHGDPRYDLAKLRHSISGGYEFIINDMFDTSVSPSDDSVTYAVHRNNEHQQRSLLFDNLLKQQYPDWFDDVLMIESLLFLSMVPLHGDSVNRQQCMLARGCELFHQVSGP